MARVTLSGGGFDGRKVEWAKGTQILELTDNHGVVWHYSRIDNEHPEIGYLIMPPPTSPPEESH